MRQVSTLIGRFVITVWTVVTLSFGLIRFLPGGPKDYLLAKIATSASTGSQRQIQPVLESYIGFKPDSPIYVQYYDYMTGIAVGDFGKSIWFNEPVADVILRALPWTLLVMILSVTLMFSIAIITGALMAYRESTPLDSGLTSVFAILNSTPYYIVAILFLAYLSYDLGVFPQGGRYAATVEIGLSVEFIWSVLVHAALPVASFVITGLGGVALQMRGNSIQILGEDYLHAGRLRGLPESRLIQRYVSRNAILPMYTQFMISLGGLFGGAIVLEKIFRYQGIGLYLFKAINTRDYPLMMGCFLIITLAVVIGVFIADLTYHLIDPRIDAGGENSESF